MKPKLEARRKQEGPDAATEEDQDLHVCMEMLRVAADELTDLRDRLALEKRRYAELFDFAPEAQLETDSRWNIREANRLIQASASCDSNGRVSGALWNIRRD